MSKIKITAEPVRINGERRWHSVVWTGIYGPAGSKSLRTWASKRAAIRAGEREYEWVRK